MRVLTISNLYPRPDQPQRGLFNAQQFRALARGAEGGRWEVEGGGRRTEDGGPRSEVGGPRSEVGGPKSEDGGEGMEGRGQRTDGPCFTQATEEEGAKIRSDMGGRTGAGDFAAIDNRQSSIANLCLVPEWRYWKWPAIRRWEDPFCTLLGTRYVPVPHIPVLGRNLAWRLHLRALEESRDRFESCDVVLATWLYPDAVAAVELGRAAGKPVWIKVHGTDRFHLENPGRRGVILEAVRRSAGVICNCEFLAGWLARAGVDRAAVSVVPNGVDTQKFRPCPRDEARGALAKRGVLSPALAQSGAPLILFAGNLAAVKGADVVLEAWLRYRSGGGAGQLVIVGAGRERSRLEAMAARAGGSVLFAGSRPHEELPLWMNACDCLCLASRSEGMPNVILEALATGLRVVATDVGACREMLRDAAGCRVVPPEDPAALAAALMETVCDREARPEPAGSLPSLMSWEASAGKIAALMAGRKDAKR